MTVETNIDPVKSQRPVFLTLLSLFAFIFFGIFSILCLLALFNSGWIVDVKDQYLPSGGSSKGMTIFIFATGSILHLTAFFGVLQIWQQKKRGYLIYSISALILAAYQLLSDQISILTTVVYISLIILFGIFYRRLD